MKLEGLDLNEAAAGVAQELIEFAEESNVALHTVAEAQVIDCGVEVAGSLRAGRMLAETCMADWASVDVRLERLGDRPCPKVYVEMDEPAIPCLLSQYAGWKVEVGKFFAMTSGPIRAILAKEPVFEKLDYSEDAEVAIAVMETRKLPNKKVIEHLVEATHIEPENLCVLVAPTASLAGSLQVIARSVETCLHKLFELDFDVSCIRSALGGAFLPPIPADDLVAIGRTNDSILYGGDVFLWVECDDDQITKVGPKVPSSASGDYGKPFATVFKEAEGDFYRLDPMLFSPAQVVFNNLRSGRSFAYGKLDLGLVERSFYAND